MMAARDFSTRRPARRWSSPQQGLLAAGSLAFLVAAWSARDAWGDHAAVTARLAQARQEAEAARQRVRELQSRRGPEQALATQALLTADAPPTRVLADLASLLPGDVRLENVELAYGEQIDVQLRVAARQPAAFDVFVDRLQQSGVFTDVLPGDEDREAEMRATVRARYRGRGL